MPEVYCIIVAARSARRRKCSIMGAMSFIVPGSVVRHPGKPEWGLGYVQSVIGHRITVNFEEAGKLLIDGSVVELDVVKDDEARP